MNPTVPTPDRIEAELDALAGWLDDVENRHEQISAC
jgi:hypothetical protein